MTRSRDQFDGFNPSDDTDGGLEQYTEVGHSVFWRQMVRFRLANEENTLTWTWPLPERLLIAREVLRERLQIPYQASEIQDRRSVASNGRGFENIVGIGIGSKEVRGIETTQDAIIVFVNHKAGRQEVQPEAFVPEEIEGVPTDVVETLGFKTLSQPLQQPSSPSAGHVSCGVSIGHHNSGETGTLGCLVTHGGSEFILSTNHILAKLGNAAQGDAILHPSPAQGGTLPNSKIGEFETSVPIQLGGPINFVDCALAKTSPQRVDPRSLCFGRLRSNSAFPQKGGSVSKCGSRTGGTDGLITRVGVIVRVDYGPSSMDWAWLDNQFLVRDTRNRRFAFSAPGDSGSLLLTKDTLEPVGLLVGGSNNGIDTIASPIDAILWGLSVLMTGPVSIIT